MSECAFTNTERKKKGYVRSLPNITTIDTSCDLLDQYGCKSLVSKLLVYTQEIDLCHMNRTSSYSHISWNSRDESSQSLVADLTYTDMPILVISRWCQCPEQELFTVIESKHVIIILDVVLCEKFVHLSSFLVVLNIDRAELESFR